MEEDGIQLPIVAVNLITSSVPVSSSEIDLIHGETARGPYTQSSVDTTFIWDGQSTEGCYHERFTLSGNYREDLSMENGLITKGARLMIPSTLRSKILEQIHQGHLGN